MACSPYTWSLVSQIEFAHFNKFGVVVRFYGEYNEPEVKMISTEAFKTYIPDQVRQSFKRGILHLAITRYFLLTCNSPDKNIHLLQRRKRISRKTACYYQTKLTPPSFFDAYKNIPFPLQKRIASVFASGAYEICMTIQTSFWHLSTVRSSSKTQMYIPFGVWYYISIVFIIYVL